MNDSKSDSNSRKFARGFFVDPETGSPKRSAVVVACLILSIALTLLFGNSPDLQPAARRALFILLLAVFLWVTEAIPAFSVGILVIGLQILLLGNPNACVAHHPMQLDIGFVDAFDGDNHNNLAFRDVSFCEQTSAFDATGSLFSLG